MQCLLYLSGSACSNVGCSFSNTLLLVAYSQNILFVCLLVFQNSAMNKCWALGVLVAREPSMKARATVSRATSKASSCALNTDMTLICVFSHLTQYVLSCPSKSIIAHSSWWWPLYYIGLPGPSESWKLVWLQLLPGYHLSVWGRQPLHPGFWDLWASQQHHRHGAGCY